MEILNYGSMNIDNVYHVDHILLHGETQMAASKATFSGGKGLNQSIAVAKAGGRVFHAGVIGEDGGILVDTLQSSGVDTRHIKRVPGPSAHTVIQVDRNGQNSIMVFAGEHMRVMPDDIAQVLSHFKAGDLLIMQNELDNSPLIMRMAAQNGMTVVFNPSPADSRLKDYPLDCVSWFLMNEIEGKALTQETDPGEILSSMKKRYPNANVVLTLGVDGSFCQCGDVRIYQPAFAVAAVDTTAAGDTFAGYFIAGIAAGEEPALAMKLAAKAAAIAVSRLGAADSIPTREEVINDQW